MIQLYEFTPLPPHAVIQLIHYAFTHLPFYGFTVFSCSRCPRKNINLPIYGFTPLRKILQIYQIDHFTLRKWHAQIVNSQIYRFTGVSRDGIYHFTVLRCTWTKDMPLTRVLHTDTTVCTGTLRNLTRYLHRNPPEPHRPLRSLSRYLQLTEPSPTSRGIYTGTFRNFMRYLHQNPPEPGVEAAPDRTGANLG